MSAPAILAIDQGTTSSRAIVFDTDGTIIAMAREPFQQIYPREGGDDGWVEHDPEVIWSTTQSVVRAAAQQAESGPCRIVAIGITNQRETTIVWDRVTGKPVYNAIVWQDRRTANVCAKLAAEGLAQQITSKTGLLIDPYFSATKVSWILDNVNGARALAAQGRLAFGTVDTFLIWRLTGGKVHATDATNASRTCLFNIHSGIWDSDLLKIFNVPSAILPEVRDCAASYGETSSDILGRKLPILGVAGDQQAAAIGQCCFAPGQIKSTYGTGCFMLMNTGEKVVQSKSRLLATVAYRLNGKMSYCLEGAIFNAGTVVQWLRDKMGLISSAVESEAMAASVESNRGVYFVPAFTGLGAPHWQPNARGLLHGLSRDTGAPEIVRAALESVAYQTQDLLDAMAKDGIRPAALKVDGGMSVNNWLMQFVSNITGMQIERPEVMETTALGAAYLAAHQAGLLDSLASVSATWRCHQRFDPKMSGEMRAQLLSGWHAAIARTI